MSALFDAKPTPDWDGLLNRPAPESLSRLVKPGPLPDPALVGPYRSEAWRDVQAARAARRGRRLELLAAGLAGGLCALVLRKAVDRG